MGSTEKEWPQKLFVKHGELFLKVFGSAVSGTTEGQVKGLVRIFKEFHVARRGRILDVACGIGRHAVPLARAGYKVVGLDLSPLYVRKARLYAKRKSVITRADFRVADIRQLAEALKDERPCNAILNIWTSIGYYGEEEDLRMFSTLHAHASRRCLLVVDTANRDFLLRRFQETGITDLGNLEIHERRKLHPETSQLENLWSFYRKSRGDLKLKARVRFLHRIYSLHELKALLERAGWHYRKCYGDFDLNPFKIDSHRIIVCCQS